MFSEDAAELDLNYFGPSAPMSSALESFVGAARPDEMPLDPEDHFSSESLRLIRIWAKMLADGLRVPGGADALNRVYHE